MFANGPRRAWAITAPTLPAAADMPWAVDQNVEGKTSSGDYELGTPFLPGGPPEGR